MDRLRNMLRPEMTIVASNCCPASDCNAVIYNRRPPRTYAQAWSPWLSTACTAARPANSTSARSSRRAAPSSPSGEALLLFSTMRVPCTDNEHELHLSVAMSTSLISPAAAMAWWGSTTTSQHGNTVNEND